MVERLLREHAARSEPSVHSGQHADGIAVVPRAEAVEVLRLVNELMAREKRRIDEIKAGVLFRPEIDEALRKHGVIE